VGVFDQMYSLISSNLINILWIFLAKMYSFYKLLNDMVVPDFNLVIYVDTTS